MPFVEYGKHGMKRWVNTYQVGDVIHANHKAKGLEDMEGSCVETKLVTTQGYWPPEYSRDTAYRIVQYFSCVECGVAIEDKEFIDG